MKKLLTLTLLVALGYFMLFYFTSSGVDSSEPIDISRAQTEFFCDRLANALDTVNTLQKTIKLSVNGEDVEFPLYFYDKNDIVSEHIKVLGKWENEKIQSIHARLEEYRRGKGLQRHQVYFMDIGANLGWFSTVFAYMGYSVISFEPMPSNEILIRKNQCAWKSKERQNEWIYINKGLGEATEECRLMSGNDNFGDGVIDCKNTVFPSIYGQRAKIQVSKLDDLISPSAYSIGLVKIDVESFEKFVLKGGQTFFSSPNIKSIFIELLGHYGTCSHNEKCKEYSIEAYYLLKQYGFTISKDFLPTPLDVDGALAIVDASAWK